MRNPVAAYACGEPTPFAIRAMTRNALRFPWIRPRDAERAESLAIPAAPLGIGEVLLVAVESAGKRASLWRCAWSGFDRAGAADVVPFQWPTREMAARLGQLALALAPHVHTAEPVVRGAPYAPADAELLLRVGEGVDQSLSGESFGLGLFLAASSALLARPVPAHLATSARVLDDGRLGDVACLEEKLRVLADNALGVTTLLVDIDQEARARELVRSMGASLEIVGLRYARDAFAVAFGADALDEPPPAWRQSEGARAALTRLLRTCKATPNLPAWRPVVRAAELLARCPLGEAQRRDLRFAEAIARRHAGEPGIGLAWSEHVPTATAFERAAHVLQAATDAGLAELPSYLEAAHAMVDLDMREGEGRKLMGAIARAYGANRDYERAARWARQATLAWMESAELDDATLPLSEWVRAAAMLDESAHFDEAAGHAHELLRERAPELARGQHFVRRSLGRAMALRGRPREAVDTLAPILHARPTTALTASAERWTARCLAALGDPAGADALRAPLLGWARCWREANTAELDDALRPASLLVALDVALEAARAAPTPEALADVDAAIEAIRLAELQAVHALVDPTLPLLGRGERLAREYPY